MTVLVDLKNPNTFKFSMKSYSHHSSEFKQHPPFFKHTTTSCSNHSVTLINKNSRATGCSHYLPILLFTLPRTLPRNTKSSLINLKHTNRNKPLPHSSSKVENIPDRSTPFLLHRELKGNSSYSPWSSKSYSLHSLI
jgi:hypothetical protein